MADPSKPRVYRSTMQRQLVRAPFDDPDLMAIVLFCTIGLLTALNVILRFPDLGGTIAQFNQF
jgi:hypothetical protein